MRTIRFPIRFLLFLLAGGWPPCWAQQGSLAGTVVDEAGHRLPGVEVRLHSTQTGAERVVITRADGRFEAPGLPLGSYTVSASLEGFTTVRKEHVFVPFQGTTATRFVLPVAAAGEEVVIRSMVNAASNRPPYIGQSSLSPGGVVVFFGQNLGPEVLETASAIPLGGSMAGVEAFVQQGEERHPVFPLYTQAGQSAFVLSSETRPGPAKLFLRYQGNLSRGFSAVIAPAQPSIFTVNSDGQGRGIFTDTNFRLFTPGRAAKPGDVVIGWGSGWGRSTADDRAVVHDKRSEYTDFRFSLGGVSIPKSDFLYIGSGGFPGGDQIIFRIPEDVKLGSGVLFSGGVFAGGAFRTVNPVTIPISQSGGPSGDPHGLSSGQVARMAARGTLTVGTTRVTEKTLASASSRLRSAEVAFTATRFTERRYDNAAVPPPLGSCFYEWRPQHRTAPLPPLNLAVSGSMEVKLPSLNVSLSQSLGSLPFFQFFDSPPNLTDGPFQITLGPNFAVSGTRMQGTWSGQYTGASGDILDQLFRNGIPSTLAELYEEAAGVDAANHYVDYEARYTDDSFGTHAMRCSVNLGVRTDLEGPAVAQERELREALIPPNPALTEIRVRVAVFGAESVSRDGPLDMTREEFDAFLSAVLTGR